MMTPEERFWLLVEKTDDHWLWTGAKSEWGYGRFHVKPGTWVPAGRYAWELTYGPLKGDELVLVTCREWACVNPKHLALGTHKDQVHAGNSPPGINARKTHCIRGHEFTPENTLVYSKGPQKGGRRCRTCARMQQKEWSRKFAEAERKPAPSKAVLKKLMYAGKSWREIGLEYGVTDTAVRKWVKKHGLLEPFGR